MSVQYAIRVKSMHPMFGRIRCHS